jgi:putative ABC transport system permease protein|tara:strand:- start:58359 stop:59603 length:1245 start_codon:yes stop_codon:yes gene_type:complete
MKIFIFDIDTWQEIYGSIRKNKLRTGITILGVMWGIFLLIVLLGSARGVENSFNKLFGDFATNTVFMWGQNTSKPFQGFQEGRRMQLKMSDAKAIERELEGIEYIVPRFNSNSLVINKMKSVNIGVFGDFPSLDEIQKKNLEYGRFINENDIEYKKKVCVIEDETYKQLFDIGERAVGQYIKINNVNFKVIGHYKNGMRVGGPSGGLHIPFSTFQQVYNKGDNIGWLAITGKQDTDIEQLELDVKLLLKNLHGVHPEDERAFGSANMGSEFKKITGFLTGMQFLTWFVGIATLIAGVFAIGNILLITVKERTQEIGIRRALGAKPSEIRKQIVLESVFLTTLAGSLGIILGGFVLMVVDHFISNAETPFLVNPTVNIPVILIAYGALVVLGTLIGLIPAQVAVKMRPIEALSDE